MTFIDRKEIISSFCKISRLCLQYWLCHKNCFDVADCGKTKREMVGISFGRVLMKALAAAISVLGTGHY